MLSFRDGRKTRDLSNDVSKDEVMRRVLNIVATMRQGFCMRQVTMLADGARIAIYAYVRCARLSSRVSNHLRA